MTLRQIRLGLLLPLAFGCAHAVYDNQPDAEDTSNSVDTPSGAGSSTVPILGSNKPSGGASSVAGSSSTGSGGADSEDSAGKGAGGAATAGASTGGAASGGAPSAGAANGGAPSAGAPSGGAPSAGAPAGGAPSAGAPAGGAPSGGSTGDACSTTSAWTAKQYSDGDIVKNGGKLYKCKPYPYSGWCGTLSAYTPGTGFAWADAWDLIGSC